MNEIAAQTRIIHAQMEIDEIGNLNEDEPHYEAKVSACLKRSLQQLIHAVEKMRQEQERKETK